MNCLIFNHLSFSSKPFIIQGIVFSRSEHLPKVNVLAEQAFAKG